MKDSKPDIFPAEKPAILSPQLLKLSNNIPVYLLNVGKEELVKIEFIFNAGSIYSENPLLAETVNSLLDAGTNNFSSEDIAERLDFFGAFIEKFSGFHKSKLILYTLNKYVDQTIAIIADIINDAVFPDKEIDIYVQNKFQNFLINRKKTEIISHELFLKHIFGENHPYGKSPVEENFKTLKRDEIFEFYQKHYKHSDLKIIIAGKIEKNHINIIDKYFGINTCNLNNQSFEFPGISGSNLLKYSQSIENTVQSSIKIGKITINKKHPDFFKLNITTILLGGYFGSRLMKNIREDKGYTYGIYASNTSLINAGFFSVSADTGNNVLENALVEIYRELKKLRTEKVNNLELFRVKNWISGNMLKAFDGPFALSDTLSSALDYNLDFDFYDYYFKTIQSITPEIICETAEKYLHEESMYEITVGK